VLRFLRFLVTANFGTLVGEIEVTAIPQTAPDYLGAGWHARLVMVLICLFCGRHGLRRAGCTIRTHIGEWRRSNSQHEDEGECSYQDSVQTSHVAFNNLHSIQLLYGGRCSVISKNCYIAFKWKSRTQGLQRKSLARGVAYVSCNKCSAHPRYHLLSGVLEGRVGLSRDELAQDHYRDRARE